MMTVSHCARYFLALLLLLPQGARAGTPPTDRESAPELASLLADALEAEEAEAGHARSDVDATDPDPAAPTGGGAAPAEWYHLPRSTHGAPLSLIRGGLHAHRFHLRKEDPLLVAAFGIAAVGSHMSRRYNLLRPGAPQTGGGEKPMVGPIALGTAALLLVPIEWRAADAPTNRSAAARHAGRLLVIGESILPALAVTELVTDLSGTSSAAPASVALIASGSTAWTMVLVESRRRRGVAADASAALFLIPAALTVGASALAMREVDDPLPVVTAAASGALFGMIFPAVH